MNRYRIEQGPDGIMWVSIQPLMEDMREALDQLIELDVSSLKEEDETDFNMRILGLKAIYTFLGSLVTEHNLKLAKEGFASGQLESTSGSSIH